MKHTYSLHAFYFSPLHVLFLLFLAACTDPFQQKFEAHQLTGFDYATYLKSSPDSVFAVAQKLPKMQQDTLYGKVFKQLMMENKNKLLLENTFFYEKLREHSLEDQALYLQPRAEAHLHLGNYDSSIALLTYIHEELGDKLAPTQKTSLAHARGMAYRLTGDYANCTKSYLEGMDVAAKSADSAQFYTLQAEQAIVYYLTKNQVPAITFATTAAAWFEQEKDTSMLGYVHTILGLAYTEKGTLDSALLHAEKSLQFNRLIGDTRSIAESLNNVSLVYRKQKKWAEASQNLKLALPMMEAAEDFRNVSIVRGNLGVCLSKEGKKKEAIDCFFTSATEQEARRQWPDATVSYGRLADTYSETGDFEQAYRYTKKKEALRDSVFQAEKQRDINELNVRFETAQKEYQISSLQQQKALTRLWLSLAISCLAVLAAILGFLYYRLLQNRKMHEKEEQLHRAREDANEKTRELATMELKHNKKQLEMALGNLSEKNRLIEELRSNLNTLQESMSLVSEMPEGAAQLDTLYGMKILTDEDWSEFRNKFERVFPGFMTSLRVDFPGISEAELRMAMLLRMDVRPKEIASMLGVSTDSVGKARYRLRKRLGLGKDDNLEAFLLGK